MQNEISTIEGFVPKVDNRFEEIRIALEDLSALERRLVIG
jgi:hypothetical protein